MNYSHLMTAYRDIDKPVFVANAVPHDARKTEEAGQAAPPR